MAWATITERTKKPIDKWTDEWADAWTMTITTSPSNLEALEAELANVVMDRDNWVGEYRIERPYGQVKHINGTTIRNP